MEKKPTHPDMVARNIRKVFEETLLKRLAEDDQRRDELMRMEMRQDRGFWARLMDLLEKNSDRRHDWRMANHKLNEQNTAHIHYDEIGVLKTTVILFAEMILFVAVYGVIMIAKWLLWGV